MPDRAVRLKRASRVHCWWPGCVYGPGTRLKLRANGIGIHMRAHLNSLADVRRALRFYKRRLREVRAGTYGAAATVLRRARTSELLRPRRSVQ